MIYADYNGSAPIKSAVTNYLKERFNDDEYSNPNATHALGKKTLFKMEKSRRSLARVLNCKPHQITFNSGSSEGISHIFYALLDQGPQAGKNVIITSQIEHLAIIQCCEKYKEKGFQVAYVDTDNNGQININHFQQLLQQYKNKVALVTIIAANNETGVVQPYREIGQQCQDEGILFFSDTTQYIGKAPFDFMQSNMDFAVCSSHKIGALIGSGFIISKKPELLSPFIFGGGQEYGHRGGTQNYIGIETMGVAIEQFSAQIDQLKQVAQIREKFESRIKEKFPSLYIVGESAPRLASTTMLGMPGIKGQMVQAMLEGHGVYVTTSSACSDAKKGNRVLEAMGLSSDICDSVVRISLCLNSNQALYDRIEDKLTQTYNKLREIYQL